MFGTQSSFAAASLSPGDAVTLMTFSDDPAVQRNHKIAPWFNSKEGICINSQMFTLVERVSTRVHLGSACEG